MRSPKTFILVALFLFAASQVPAQTKFGTYSNVRFGYRIQYPTAIFDAQPEADNGDGRVLEAKDGGEIRVWGMYNALGQTLKASFDSDLKEIKGEVTYKVLLKNSYVISGKANGKIFYQKTILKGRDGDTGAIVATFYIRYAEGSKAKYDSLTARIAKSFVFN